MTSTVKSSRVVITTILGAVFGVVCMLLCYYTGDIAFWPLGVAALLNHAVMGFAIGVSAIRMNWAVHGVIWGALFGVFSAIGFVGTSLDWWGVFIFMIIWGFLIELLATTVFKRPAQ